MMDAGALLAQEADQKNKGFINTKYAAALYFGPQ
jgi:hypothetical protein